jgi:hypothetical protein
VEGWNACASELAGAGLAGTPVAPLPHPCLFSQGNDFVECVSSADAEAALMGREAWLAREIAAAKKAAGKLPGYWPLSDLQEQLLDALGDQVKGDVELALALDPEDLALVLDPDGFDERGEGGDRPAKKMRTFYREISELLDLGLVAHDRGLGYYRSDRRPDS